MKINQRIHRVLAFSIGILTLMACSQNPNEESHQDREGIHLDNGQKWKANLETIEHVHAMDTLITENDLNADNVKYQAIAKQLFMELKMVFDECTMTGESHEQLHTFLMPMHKSISKLMQNKSENPAETLAEIKTHLAEFDEYFE